MPRKARIRIAGLPVHVVQRGNNRCDCFANDADYATYLRLLAEARTRESCQVHAYVLMTNHVHLLLTGSRVDSISATMKRVGELYVRHFNRSQGRSGTLWEGRYYSSIVDTQNYLLRCYRYIELNPVRARMVLEPAHYRWSSHKANAYGDRDELVSPHPTYLAMDSEDRGRLGAYRRLFDGEVDPQELQMIRAALNGGFALGSPEFLARLEAKMGRRVERMTKGRIRVSTATTYASTDSGS